MLIGAIEAGGTNMICSIGTMQAGVMQRASFPTLTPEETMPKVIEFIRMFDVKALGVGSFGPLNLNPDSPEYGSITNTPKKEWRNFPLLKTLTDALGVPARLDTAVNAAALAEHRLGAGKGTQNMLYVSVGAGVGGGIIINGEPVHGLVHPELGHMIVIPQENDPMPDGVCPFHGHCLEGLAAEPAIERRWGLPHQLMTEDHPAWVLEANYIAQMCVSAIVTFSPEVIILGGSVMQHAALYDMIRADVLAMLGGYVASEKLRPEEISSYIVPPALGIHSGVTGAMLLAAQALEQRAASDSGK